MKIRKAFFLMPIFIFFSCNYFFQLSSDENLTKQIERKFYEKKVPVDLFFIKSFEWDNYIVIGCYENPKIVGEREGLDLKNIYNNSITYSDNFVLLVFLHNRKSVKICKLDLDVKISEDLKYNKN